MTVANRWVLALAVLVGSAAATIASGPADVAYQHDLADFTGTIACSDARVVVDAPRSEVYTLFANEIRVFNSAGMEIYSFTVDPTERRVVDLAVEEDGDILLLVYPPSAGESRAGWSVVRADYRGRPVAEVALDRSGAAAGLLPNRLYLRSGKLWLLSLGQMRAAAYSPGGSLERALDLAELAALPEEDRGNGEVSGFDVAGDGTVFFAIPVQFRVHAIAPDGTARSFGKVGSAAGNFGVLGDLAVDREGNLYVADRLRSVVMLFDAQFRFLREFGKTGHREWLVRPGNLALDPAGKLYVSQVRDRGIAVFAIVSPE